MKITLWVSLSLLALSTMGCQAGRVDTLTPETPDASYTPAPGDSYVITTDDLASAQGLNPFTILLPDYLPEEVGQRPGFRIWHQPDKGTNVDITYGGGEAWMWIVETDKGIAPSTSEGNARGTITSVADVQVSISQYTTYYRDNPNVSAHIAHFLHNGIFFTIELLNLEQEGLVKIVESIVTQ